MVWVCFYNKTNTLPNDCTKFCELNIFLLMKIVDSRNFFNKTILFCLLTASIVTFFAFSTGYGATETGAILSLIGAKDSLMVVDPQGKIVISKNDTQKLLPASILKIFTSLVAIHYLGLEYRYRTEFFIDNNSNLKIKGFGDPLLISEVVRDISHLLAALLGQNAMINDLVVDDAYFIQPLTIPGVSSSSQPYDAPNGALCVNFNTVFFKDSHSGFISAEPQTPLLPFAENLIHKRKLKTGRIVLSHEEKENTIYAGKLFEYFLKQEGVLISGQVKPGKVNYNHDRLIFRYTSRFSLTEIISKLLEHSNNFTTNQLLITAGIKAFGPPGNLKKGVEAAMAYATRELSITDMILAEGSGISRQNRISAREMMRALEAFEPNFVLLRQQGRDFFKTGTLNGINTRAGYIASKNGGRYRYVVMVNTNGKSTKPIMRQLLRILE
jgi:D-alanyl-D-alanine carboxypeptidase/D-alanyl-D-alanine-endopeptidase (penicillin-binding protein 4)